MEWSPVGWQSVEAHRISAGGADSITDRQITDRSLTTLIVSWSHNPVIFVHFTCTMWCFIFIMFIRVFMWIMFENCNDEEAWKPYWWRFRIHDLYLICICLIPTAKSQPSAWVAWVNSSFVSLIEFIRYFFFAPVTGVSVPAIHTHTRSPTVHGVTTWTAPQCRSSLRQMKQMAPTVVRTQRDAASG